MFKNFKSKLRQFSACTRGNIGMMLGLSAIPLLMGAGSAVDFGRYTNINHDVAVALDAGLMAAAASIFDDTDITEADITAAKERGKLFFETDLGTPHGATIEKPVFTYDAANNTFSAVVTGKVDTNFLVVAGFPELEVKVKAEAFVGRAEIIGSDVEVSMMLDVTGSMCNVVNGNYAQPCTTSDSMDALKKAAKDLVKEVIWKDQTDFKSRVAIVPFSSRVRLAPDGEAGPLYTAVTGMPSTWSGYTYVTNTSTVTTWVVVSPTVTKKSTCESKSNQRWNNSKCEKKVDTTTSTTTYTHHVNLKAKPCVTERYVRSTSELGLTEDAPAAGRYNNGNDGTRSLTSLDSTNTAITPDGSTQANAVSSVPANYTSTGACDGGSIHTGSTVVPLTSDETTLNNRIDALVAQNGTAGVLGTSFAWYAISPEWASVWGSASAPDSYSKTTELNEAGKPKLYKIAVLMTDGEYNTAIAATSNPSVSTLNTKALELCSAMKAKKIEVYTIGFKLPSSSAARTMLDSCATDGEDYFYDATDSTKLKAAFKKIGERIKSQAKMEIRLTQ
jgi:Flp pilus assembly protein TadG